MEKLELSSINATSIFVDGKGPIPTKEQLFTKLDREYRQKRRSMLTWWLIGIILTITSIILLTIPIETKCQDSSCRKIYNFTRTYNTWWAVFLVGFVVVFALPSILMVATITIMTNGCCCKNKCNVRKWKQYIYKDVYDMYDRIRDALHFDLDTGNNCVYKIEYMIDYGYQVDDDEEILITMDVIHEPNISIKNSKELFTFNDDQTLKFEKKVIPSGSQDEPDEYQLLIKVRNTEMWNSSKLKEKEYNNVYKEMCNFCDANNIKYITVE